MLVAKIGDAKDSLVNKARQAGILALGLGLFIAIPSRADSGPYTRGDAEAVFNAFVNGGWTIRLHSPTGGGSPAQGNFNQVAIRPFSGSGWDGEHICVSDYHTILMSSIDGRGADPAYPYNLDWTRADVAAYLAQVKVSFTLDGAPLGTIRTPLKPFLNPEHFGLLEAWAVTDGRIMAPEDLPVGRHTLGVSTIDPIWGNGSDGITFYVDPPGSPSCFH